jgi:deoxyribonuclease-4
MQIGPAGNSRRFYDEGFKKSEQAFAWIHALGLTAYEYSMGRGVHLSRETALQIGGEARRYGIRTSVHAPYFINCGSAEPEKRLKSIDYLLQAARAADWLGADRVVFHMGSPGRLGRVEAMALAKETLGAGASGLNEAGLSSTSSARKRWAASASWARWTRSFRCARRLTACSRPSTSATCTWRGWAR